MLFIDRYLSGPTRLTLSDQGYKFLLTSLSVFWWVIVSKEIWWDRTPPVWRAAMGYGSMVLALVLAYVACITYKTVVGQRGLVTPRRYCLSYAGILLLLTIVCSWKGHYGLLLWGVLILTAWGLRTLIEFRVPHWIGETGAYIKQAGWVERHYQLDISNGEPSLCWAGMRIPVENIACFNFAVFGGIGSGKTLTLRLLMQSIVPHIGAPMNDASSTKLLPASRDSLSLPAAQESNDSNLEPVQRFLQQPIEFNKDQDDEA